MALQLPVISTGRPLWIGITSRHGRPEWLQQNTRNYLAMVASYQATPVVLTPDLVAILPDGQRYTPSSSGRLPEAVLDALDGLILSGGGDVAPHYFNQPLAGAEEESIDLKRDELEIGLAQAALARNLPIFGICRGCQVLNVAAGGAMIQHLDGHRSPMDGATRFHAVRVAETSRLHEIVGADQFEVNTFHHQGMDQASLAPDFRAAALADPDHWLVEAYESMRHTWVIGVQWHPERIFELGEAHRRLWESFITACSSYRQRTMADG
ncbi:MAG TPA: gamma-glutamyl-gamma-aminobutyrate hydrolase family protein [Chloroflexi bacterium]|nr:gamma-glutamyl-gamma-aminobutyrate hydrolase family protein [Chloroflexota bacterium]